MLEVRTMSSDALRIYIRALRAERDKTQLQVAEAMGLSLRAFTDWERGRTKTIKSHLLMRAVAFLRGDTRHINQIETNIKYQTEEKVLELVASVVNPVHAQRAVALAASAPEEQRRRVLAILERLQQEDRADEWLDIGAVLAGEKAL